MDYQTSSLDLHIAVIFYKVKLIRMFLLSELPVIFGSCPVSWVSLGNAVLGDYAPFGPYAHARAPQLVPDQSLDSSTDR